MKEIQPDVDDHERRRPMIWNIVSLVLTTGVVIAAVVYCVRHADKLHLIRMASPSAIALMVVARLIGMLCFGVQLKVLMQCYGVELTALEWFGLSRVTSASNLLLPLGGTAVKAAYLKERHQFRYRAFLASQLFAALLRMALLALLAVPLLLMSAHATTPAVAGLTAVLIGTLALLLVSDGIHEAVSRRFPRLAVLITEWQRVRSSRETVIKLLLISLGNFLATAIGVALSFHAFGVSVPFAMPSLIAALTGLSSFLRLFPENLGIKEAIFLTISGIWGPGVNEGLHAAALDRAVGLSMTLIFALVFTRLLSQRVTRGNHH